jgi:hypothetical protein
MAPRWIESMKRNLSRVGVEDRDVGLEAAGDERGILSRHTGTDDDDLAPLDTGCSPEQQPPSTVAALEEVRTHLRRDTAGDLAHRGEQRQSALVVLHRLVGDGGTTRALECGGDVRIGREVEIREQHEIRPQEVEFGLVVAL